MELFERLAYYGQQIVFMIYLRNRLGFSEAEAGSLSGIFGGLIYLLPILAGTLADKWGFRRAFSIAFSILASDIFSSARWACRRFPESMRAPAVLGAARVSSVDRLRRILHQAVGARDRGGDDDGKDHGRSVSPYTTGS